MMQTYIALLRGINVGGKNILPMADLRQWLTDAGLANVRTYIQSGNVAFESDKGTDALSQLIQTVIGEQAGFTPRTLVMTSQDMRTALANNPFETDCEDGKTAHLLFLTDGPTQQAVQKAKALAADSERCELIGSVFYLHAPNGIGRSKLAAGAEKALGVAATARYLRSARRILELAEKE